MAVQTTRTLPAQFVEDLGKDLATQVVAQSGVPTVSVGLAGISQRPGEATADFQARQQAAREFETRQQSLAGLAPQVADQNVLQQTAARLGAEAAGIDPTTGKKTGLASFEPFLQTAGQQAQVAAGLGTQALGQLGTAGATLGGVPLGAQAFQQDVSDFMSPYQSQVIDASLAEFDRNKATQNLGAFQSGLAGQQAQLGAQTQALQGTDISRLGSLGALNQAQAQAQLDAQREAARQATFLPQEQLDRFAGQVTGIMGGYPGQFQSTVVPNPTPLQTALGVGTTLAGIYGATNPTRNLFGPAN